MLCHQIIMYQVAVQRGYEIFITAFFETYSVIFAGIVYQSVYSSKLKQYIIHCRFAGLRIRSFSSELISFLSGGLQAPSPARSGRA